MQKFPVQMCQTIPETVSEFVIGKIFVPRRVILY